MVEEKTRQREMSEEQNLKSSPLEDVKLQENELRDDTITGSGQDSITKACFFLPCYVVYFLRELFSFSFCLLIFVEANRATAL